MSVMQQLRDSGLFCVHFRASSEIVRFTVRHWGAASVWAQPNDREIHIRVRALGRSCFPNNAVLAVFVCENTFGMNSGPENENWSFKLAEEHIGGLIEIIREGL